MSLRCSHEPGELRDKWIASLSLTPNQCGSRDHAPPPQRPQIHYQTRSLVTRKTKSPRHQWQVTSSRQQRSGWSKSSPISSLRHYSILSFLHLIADVRRDRYSGPWSSPYILSLCTCPYCCGCLHPKSRIFHVFRIDIKIYILYCSLYRRHFGTLSLYRHHST
jgi:hypothetical protein